MDPEELVDTIKHTFCEVGRKNMAVEKSDIFYPAAVLIVFKLLIKNNQCWERVNMGLGMDPNGRLEGPNIRTCTRPF